MKPSFQTLSVRLLLCLLLALLASPIAFADSSKITITDYHEAFIPGYDKQGNLSIAIRTYNANKVPYYLVVNPNTFATQSMPAASFAANKAITDQALQNTPYIKALARYSLPPYLLQNYGITQADHLVNGMFLTVDMCPSLRPFEKNFFNVLVALADKNHSATPVAISITGLWMESHQKEFHWFIDQANTNKLQITWINHSFNHFYYVGLPLKSNFLLRPRTNFSYEVLATEKMLLENGQTPSVFFRFPGLVSNQQLVLQLNKFGLITIGSNAWLAKGQPAKPGSIILVHGNGNEPRGIALVLPLLQQANLQLLPLSAAWQ